MTCLRGVCEGLHALDHQGHADLFSRGDRRGRVLFLRRGRGRGGRRQTESDGGWQGPSAGPSRRAQMRAWIWAWIWA